MRKSKGGSVVFFWLLEVNLILWIIVGYQFIPFDSKTSNLNFSAYFVLAGFLLAAFLQHWAYYNIYKVGKEDSKSDELST